MRILCLLLALAVAPAWGATCKISEYRYQGRDDRGNLVPAALEPAVTTQEVTYTTSAQSSVLNADTHFVRIVCDAKAHYVFSTAGTNATATDPYLTADVAEYFSVTPGASMIIDFYDGSS